MQPPGAIDALYRLHDEVLAINNLHTTLSRIRLSLLDGSRTMRRRPIARAAASSMKLGVPGGRRVKIQPGPRVSHAPHKRNGRSGTS